VIEGRLLPGVREPEGPFGEFPKYYSAREDREVIEIDAVTHRRNPIYHTIVPAEMEHLLLGGIPREATLLSHLQRSFPGVLDVHLSVGGVCRYHLYVKIKKKHEGEAKNVIVGAFGGHYDIKQVIVVDDGRRRAQSSRSRVGGGDPLPGRPRPCGDLRGAGLDPRPVDDGAVRRP
jgi:2,5-furandicarboxylate decarboxylase 1